jgi:hypothetical protein
MRPMWRDCFSHTHTEELSNDNLLELEKELNDDDDESSEGSKLKAFKQSE